MAFYDTQGINDESREPYTDITAGSLGFKLTEDYKFDITDMRLTDLQGHKDAPGLSAGAIGGSAPGKATVAHDINVRVGADGQGDYKFQDCTYISGTAPGLSIAFTGEKQSFIDDAVTNGHGNGYALNYLHSHNYVASVASTHKVHNADKTCDLHFKGTHDLEFPIDKMLTSYWKSSDCAHATACNGKADITFGSDSADVWAGAAVTWSTETMSVQEIDVVTLVADPTSKFTTYNSSIPMAGNLFGVTYKTNSAATLETEVTFLAPVDPATVSPGAVTGCSTPQTQLKLYQIPEGNLLTYIKAQVDSCIVTYPVNYNVDYKIKFDGEESNEYRMLATDIGADVDFTLQFSGESTLSSIDNVTFDYANAITGRGFSADQAQIESCAAATIVVDPIGTPLPDLGATELATSCVTGGSATASHKTSSKVYSASSAFNTAAVKSHQTSSGSHFGDMLCDTVTIDATVVAQVKDIAGELPAVPLFARATFTRNADAHVEADDSLSVPDWTHDTATVTHGDDRTAHGAVTVVYTPESDVTIDSTTTLQLTAESVPGKLQYNCDNDDSDRVITYSVEAQLPCKAKTTTVSKPTAYSVKYDKATQAELLQTVSIVGTADEIATSLAPGAITEKAHHDIREADTGYLQATTKYTSTAIQNDGDLRHLSCDGSDDDHPCSMTYVTGGTSDSSDDYVLFTVLFKKQIINGPTPDYISNGAASRATITYTFNERCSSETTTATFDPTFTIRRVDDKYRGRIEVSDYLNTGNTKVTYNSSYDDHLDDITIDFGLQLGLGVYDESTNPNGVRNPSIYGVFFYKETKQAEKMQSFTVSWDINEVKWVPDPSGVPDHTETSQVINIDADGAAAGHLYFQPVKPADASVVPGASAGNFDITIKSGTSSRVVTINIINLEPPARLEVKEDGTTHKFANTGETITLCKDYSCYTNVDGSPDIRGYKQVSFLMNIDTVSIGSVTQRSVSANGEFITQKTVDVKSNSERQFFTVNSTNCKNYGTITLVLDNSVGGTSVGDDITSTIRFPCRRAADSVDFRSTTKLDYTINFQASLDTQSLTFGDQFAGVTSDITTSDLSSSFPLTCRSGGSTGGTAKCNNGEVISAAQNIDSLKSMSDFFKDCGSWTTSNALRDVGEMKIVRKFTGTQSSGSSQQYCQINSLEWTVYKTGSSSQTVTVQGYGGGAEFRFDLDKLEYTKCTSTSHKYAFEISGEVSIDGGSTWSESGLKLQDVTFSGEPNGLVDNGGVEDHLVTAGATPGECSDYCATSSHGDPVTVSFTAVYVLPSTSQTIHADVTATLQMLGDPCSSSYVPEITQSDMETAAAPTLEFQTVATATPCVANDAWASTVSPTVNQKLCAKIVKASDTYPATLTSFTFKDNSTGTLLKSFGSSGDIASLQADTVNFLAGYVSDDFWLDSLQADTVIEVTAFWTIDINSGGRRMLRTTYTLGSNYGESHASIQILPAGVQIQEQIEAGVEAAPAHDVIYNGTVLNTTGTSLPDHEHHNANWGLGLGITGSVVGVGLIVVWMYTGWKRKQNGRDWLGVGSGYQKVGRFETNMAF